MTRWPGRQYTPRGLLILLATIIAAPAATLLFLGVRLMQQDRAVERQRRAEILQDASDRAVNALERELSGVKARLADPVRASARPAAGSISVVLTRADVRIEPADAVAFWPAPSPLRDIPIEPFR